MTPHFQKQYRSGKTSLSVLSFRTDREVFHRQILAFSYSHQPEQIK